MMEPYKSIVLEGTWQKGLMHKQGVYQTFIVCISPALTGK